jgi:hypothetical protein
MKSKSGARAKHIDSNRKVIIYPVLNPEIRLREGVCEMQLILTHTAGSGNYFFEKVTFLPSR